MFAIKQHYNFNNEERPAAAVVVCKPIFHKETWKYSPGNETMYFDINNRSEFAFFVQTVVVLYIFRVFSVEIVP